MSHVTCIIDPTTGDLTVEGLSVEEASALAGDLFPPPRRLDCARPLVPVCPSPSAVQGESMLRAAAIYHGSVVEGPGRRSVLQLQGCPIRCRGCAVRFTHDPAGGVAISVADAVAALLDPIGEPRDGISILGGEAFYQPEGLAALLRAIKARDIHTVVYTGYTVEALLRRPEVSIREALELTDLLIDGPFVLRLADAASEWRGSRNQRIIHHPGRLLREAG